MARCNFFALLATFVGCAGPGWQHEPIDYVSLIEKGAENNYRLEIEIVDTSDTETQTMVYAGVGFYGERSWQYDQLGVLSILAAETETTLNAADNEAAAVTLRVSGTMQIDRQGDYTASLIGELMSESNELLMRAESSGFIESKVASEVAFENAYKLAFQQLLKDLSLIQ